MKPIKLFKAKVPDLQSFIGRTVEINGHSIKIQSIVGNVGMTLGRKPKDMRPQYYEINGQYLISMLRFHAQMEGATDITEEEFKQFEEMEFFVEKADSSKEPRSPIEIDPEALKKGEVKFKTRKKNGKKNTSHEDSQ